MSFHSQPGKYIERLRRLKDKIHQLQQRMKWLTRILTVAVIPYFAYLIFSNWEYVRQINWTVFALPVFLSLFVYLLSTILQLGIWLSLISVFHKISMRDLEIYMRTILLRQLPGGVWHWLGRSNLYELKTQVRTEGVLLAVFIDWLLILLMAIGTFAVVAIEQAWWLRLILGITAVAGVLTLAWLWFAGAAWYKRLLHGLFWIAAYFSSWSLGGLLLMLLVNADSQTAITLLKTIEVWAIANGISSIMVFAPSGLALREVSLTILLQPFNGVAGAVIVAVILRLTFSVSDLLWGATGWFLTRRMGGGDGRSTVNVTQKTDSVS